MATATEDRILAAADERRANPRVADIVAEAV